MSNTVVPARGATIAPNGTGKSMNCQNWGTYEAPGTSSTEGFCNGGTVDGELWAECESKSECRAERNRRAFGDGRHHLPVTSPSQSLVRVVGGQGGSMPTRFGPPSTLPTKTITPTQIVTPDNTNPYLNTPRVLNSGRAGQHSPTFLPRPGEHWLYRFFKNVIQGGFNAIGHHIAEFTQSVDLFPFNDPKRLPKPDEEEKKTGGP